VALSVFFDVFIPKGIKFICRPRVGAERAPYCAGPKVQFPSVPTHGVRSDSCAFL
jgi:hypothetical protein